MRIALAQTSFTPRSIAQSFARIDALAGEAAAGGAALVMFPEAFLCGYGDAETTHALAISGHQPGLEAAQEIARHRGIGLLFGYAEASHDQLHNSAALLSSGGEVVLTVRKMHLWGDFEHRTFRPGGRGSIVSLSPELHAGVLICYDLEHAVAAEDLARRGANVILCISATWAGYEVVPRVIVPARAYENAVYVAFCNRVGRAHGIDYAGLSTVADPCGQVTAMATAHAEALLFADLDAAALSPAMGLRPTHADRRNDIFPQPPDFGG